MLHAAPKLARGVVSPEYWGNGVPRHAAASTERGAPRRLRFASTNQQNGFSETPIALSVALAVSAALWINSSVSACSAPGPPPSTEHLEEHNSRLMEEQKIDQGHAQAATAAEASYDAAPVADESPRVRTRSRSRSAAAATPPAAADDDPRTATPRRRSSRPSARSCRSSATPPAPPMPPPPPPTSSRRFGASRTNTVSFGTTRRGCRSRGAWRASAVTTPRVHFHHDAISHVYSSFPRRQLDHAHVRHGREHDWLVEAVGHVRLHPRGHRVLHAVRAAILG